MRLVHKSTGKLVPDAAIMQTHLDMTPDGMTDMATFCVPLDGQRKATRSCLPAPGGLRFKTVLASGSG
ncbi:MAG: hypothetical protein ACXWC1_34340 [Burkholderiales bacterium]